MSAPQGSQNGCGSLIGLFVLGMISVQLLRNCASTPVQQVPVYVPVPQQSPPAVVNPFTSPTPEYGMNGGVKCTTNQNPISGEISTTCNPN
jgi:hypothetical protein